jgi:hypothetical protein
MAAQIHGRDRNSLLAAFGGSRLVPKMAGRRPAPPRAVDNLQVCGAGLRLASDSFHMLLGQEELSVQIAQSYNEAKCRETTLEVAAEIVQMPTEGERISENQLTQGVALDSARRQASGASYGARAELLQVRMTHLLAWAELEQTIGRTPRR